MNNSWFWQNKFMGWIEGKLISLANWFWNKRHQPHYPKKEPQVETTNENKKKSPAKKAPAKRTPAKKKTDWNVK